MITDSVSCRPRLCLLRFSIAELIPRRFLLLLLRYLGFDFSGRSISWVPNKKCPHCPNHNSKCHLNIPLVHQFQDWSLPRSSGPLSDLRKCQFSFFWRIRFGSCRQSCHRTPTDISASLGMTWISQLRKHKHCKECVSLGPPRTFATFHFTVRFGGLNILLMFLRSRTTG